MDSLAGLWLHTWSLPLVEVGDRGSSPAFGSLIRDRQAAQRESPLVSRGELPRQGQAGGETEGQPGSASLPLAGAKGMAIQGRGGAGQF